MQKQVSVNGSLILVLGILSFVLCPLFGLISWSMGTNALRRLDEADVHDGSERGLANAGRICGIVSSLLWMTVLLLRLLAGAGR
jgi:hypothetical protein